MVLFEAFTAVVGAVAKFPVGFARLGEVPIVLFCPIGPGALDLLKVWVGVTFDGLFLIETVFVGWGVVLHLFIVAEVFNGHRAQRVPGETLEGSGMVEEGQLARFYH